MHHLAQRRVREDRMHQICLDQFSGFRDDIALDQFGNLRADHMGAQQLAGLFVKDGFDITFRLAQRNRLAIAVKRGSARP